MEQREVKREKAKCAEWQKSGTEKREAERQDNQG